MISASFSIRMTGHYVKKLVLAYFINVIGRHCSTLFQVLQRANMLKLLFCWCSRFYLLSFYVPLYQHYKILRTVEVQSRCYRTMREVLHNILPLSLTDIARFCRTKRELLQSTKWLTAVLVQYPIHVISGVFP